MAATTETQPAGCSHSCAEAHKASWVSSFLARSGQIGTRTPSLRPGRLAAMPSQQHEALLELFRNRPALAPELLRDALHVKLPPHTDVRIESTDLTQAQPTEYRADLVLLLVDGTPVLGIIVEVQLAPDPRKDYVWPVYVATLRARLECPVVLMAVTPDETTARWAARGVDLGDGNMFRALVLGPSSVPIVTDEDLARADPELAVLSAMAHGRDTDTKRSARIAAAAQLAARDLDEERSTLYYDLVQMALSEAARRALKDMAIANYQFQSEFARRYFAAGQAEGKIEGKSEGKADLLVRQLTRRFGPLPDQVRAHLATCAADELDAIGERLLLAQSIDAALGTR